MLVPMNQLPSFVQQVAAFLPTYHCAQLGWGVLGAGDENIAVSLAWLAGYAMVFFTTSLWAYRRDATRRYR